MYASHAPNTDPKPWERPTTGERFEEYFDADLIHNPREEYRQEPHNPINRVLVDFRRLLNEIIGGWEPEAIEQEAAWWLFLLNNDMTMVNPGNWGDKAGSFDHDEISFARRVLFRLSGGKVWAA